MSTAADSGRNKIILLIFEIYLYYLENWIMQLGSWMSRFRPKKYSDWSSQTYKHNTDNHKKMRRYSRCMYLLFATGITSAPAVIIPINPSLIAANKSKMEHVSVLFTLVQNNTRTCQQLLPVLLDN